MSLAADLFRGSAMTCVNRVTNAVSGKYTRSLATLLIFSLALSAKSLFEYKVDERTARDLACRGCEKLTSWA